MIKINEDFVIYTEHKKKIIKMEEKISKEDYNNFYNYLKESIKSYKNINGLLTGFSFTSLIFLFSASIGNITEENFIKLMTIIPWIIYAFAFFLINIILFYIIEISCHSINYTKDYNYKEKYNKLVKREKIIPYSNFIFMVGLMFLLISIVLIINFFAGKAVLIIIYLILLILIFIISAILLLLIIWLVSNLVKQTIKRKNR